MSIIFKDGRHEQTYGEYLDITGTNGDREYNAALYLLAAINKPLDGYLGYHSIDTSAILNASRAWGSGEKALVKLAVNLFNNTTKANVNDIFNPLDWGNVDTALTGINIRFGS